MLHSALGRCCIYQTDTAARNVLWDDSNRKWLVSNVSPLREPESIVANAFTSYIVDFELCAEYNDGPKENGDVSVGVYGLSERHRPGYVMCVLERLLSNAGLRSPTIAAQKFVLLTSSSGLDASFEICNAQASTSSDRNGFSLPCRGRTTV